MEKFFLQYDAIKGVFPKEIEPKHIMNLVSHFNYNRLDFKIDTTFRACAFLAQVLAETDYGTMLEENLNYSAERLMKVWPKRFVNMWIAKQFEHNPEKLANEVYGGRMGNKDYGDGWLYRGRGYLMLTGRDNYEGFSKFMLSAFAVKIEPDDLTQHMYAMRSAMWYWYDRKMPNKFADLGDIDSITKMITGSMVDAPRRKRLYLRLLQAIRQYELKATR